MIARVKGILIKKAPTYAYVESNGLTYNLLISLRTFERLPSENEEVLLYSSLRLKEDTIELYGFESLDEKEMFEALITISGIGPKLALNILSGISYEELANAIRTNNLARITAIPGIGKKTAERIIVELKDKIDRFASKGTNFGEHAIRNDAIQALATLGYNVKAAEKAVDEVIKLNKSVTLEEIIKLALKSLTK